MSNKTFRDYYEQVKTRFDEELRKLGKQRDSDFADIMADDQDRFSWTEFAAKLASIGFKTIAGKKFTNKSLAANLIGLLNVITSDDSRKKEIIQNINSYKIYGSAINETKLEMNVKTGDMSKEKFVEILKANEKIIDSIKNKQKKVGIEDTGVDTSKPGFSGAKKIDGKYLPKA